MAAPTCHETTVMRNGKKVSAFSRTFKLEKVAEFLPNSVLIFPRTNISYHGVSSINTGSYERNLLLLNYYFK